VSAPAAAPTPPAASRVDALRTHPAYRFVTGLQRRGPFLQLLALVLLFVYGTSAIPSFDTKFNIYSMLFLASLLGLAAAGQTLVILVGGIDFSIPAWIAAGATMTVQLTGTNGFHEWPFAVGLAVIIVTALVMGGLAGWICHDFRLPALIVTLGMAAIVSGGILAWTGGFIDGQPPVWLTKLVSPNAHTFGWGFPPLVVIWAAVALVIGFALHRTIAGRWLYSTGSNPRAAALALVPTRRVWIGTFALSAMLGALVGMLLSGFAGAGTTAIGDPYLWNSLGAVIIGGTAFGARGDYFRTVLGALILTELTQIMTGKGYSLADQEILLGIVILVVVAGYGRDRRLRDRV
jgi:ribose transport system permease protein